MAITLFTDRLFRLASAACLRPEREDEMTCEIVRRWRAMAAVAVLAAGAVALGAQEPPRELFERARLMEESGRNLTYAVKLYEQAAAAAGPDRALAAAAELHIGLVQERLGSSDAASTYQRLLKRFGDQSAAAGFARARLEALTRETRSRSQGDVTAPRWVGSYTVYPNAISADGRFTVGATIERQPRLILQDLATGGQSTVVTAPGGAARWPVISPDARQVVYTWIPSDGGSEKSSVQIVGVVPGSPSRTLPAAAEDQNVIPIAWSADARAILVRLQSKAARALAWVTVADGATRPVHTFDTWRALTNVSVSSGASPEGGWIAYSAAVAEGAADRYIFTTPSNKFDEKAVVKMAGANDDPMWTADGGHLLFINERSGTRGLWAVAMQNGAPAGEPFLIKGNFAGWPVGLTAAGGFLYVSSDDGGFSEFIADRDPVGARVVQTFKGQSGMWSPGNRLAFVRPGLDGNDLIVRSLETGEERTYQHPGISVQSPRWFHDDSALIVYIWPQGDGGSSGGSMFRLDRDTGTFTRLYARDTPGRVRSQGTLLSLDDKTLYYPARKDLQSPWTELIARDLASGEERTLVTFPGAGLEGRTLPGLSLSPDGTTLAINTWVEGSRTASRILTVRTDGTGLREVHAYEGSFFPDRLRWTPDGQSLLYVVDSSQDSGSWRIMRLPAGGGQPVAEGLESTHLRSTVPLPPVETGNIANFDISPDGTRLVFGSRTIPSYDLWTIENMRAALDRR